jgi:hypothetical protein
VARRVSNEDSTPLPPLATTLEGREDQLIAAAMDLVEERIHNKSASAQETIHFLRLGSTKAKLENEKLKAENQVLLTRVKEMEARTSSDELLQNALDAFRGYVGEVAVEVEDDYYNEDVY